MHDFTSRLAMTALSLSLASCSQQATTSDRKSGARTAAGESTAMAAASPPATSFAAAGPPGEPESESSRPPRNGAPGPTKGTVACGKVRCKAPEEGCGWNEEKR